MIDRPLKILAGADVPPDPNSGAAGTVYYTNRAFQTLGHHVDEVWSHNLNHRISHGNLHYLLELPWEYRKIIAKKHLNKKYDLIMLSQPHAWLAAKYCKANKVGGVFLNRSHGLEPMAARNVEEWRAKIGVPANRFPKSVLSFILKRILSRHNKLIAKYADGFVVPASDIASFLKKSYEVDLEKISVIHHGIPDTFMTKPIKKFDAKRHHRILYVGQFAFVKGPHILSNVISHILRKESRAEMTWVCSAKHHHQARELLPSDIKNKVNFLDWMNQKKLIDIYDNHGIFIFPSFYEGAGKAASEAMARGLCVITTDVGAMRDHIVSGDNGILCPLGDSSSMIKAAVELLHNFQYARQMSEKSCKSMHHITWENCAASIIDFAKTLSRSKEEYK